VEELPCELVREQHFLGSGVPTKQLWSRRKEMGVERERESGIGWGRPGEQGQCWECTQSKSQHQMLGKTLLTKKAHKKISRPKAGFNDRHEPPG
jgi:hypothetical protein